MSRLIFSELGTTPSDTDSGASQIYVKDDGKLYIKSGTGAEETVMKWTSGGSTSINYAGGNVGIGTTTPTTGLDVIGGTTISSTGWAVGARANSLVIDNNSGATRFFAVGADATTDGSYTFYTGQTDGGTNTRMTITNAGNVGIGTTAPAGLLHIKHATNSTHLSANHIFGIQTGGISISAVPVAKVWCSASTADTPVVHSSYNVSSVTNPSGSLQQVNFATALANNDYVVVTSCSRSSTRNGDIGVEYFNESTTSVQLQGGNSGSAQELDAISVAIFGE
jgi:hypothetical protein